MTSLSRWTRPFSRMSTGQKVLLVLALALMPLGLIAVVSSMETARAAQETRDNTAQLATEVGAARLSSAIARTAISLRATSTAVAIAGPNSGRCAETLDALAGLERYDVRFAILGDDDETICATPGFSPRPMEAATGSGAVVTRLDPEAGSVRFVVAGANRQATGIAEIPRQSLYRLARPDNPAGRYRITLSQAGNAIVLYERRADSLPDDARRAEAEVANGQLVLAAQFAAPPIRFAEVLTIALPVLMWLAAALLGWWAVDRMVVRPLARLQRAVARQGKSGGEFRLPATRTPATEIRDLGKAFKTTIAALQENEHQLEAGLIEQRRLTREVHHRVKNNLQVVASLLNLHARSAVSPETAAAYASIQRRVDALAIVQRNLLAEAEADRGIAIRPVISELASGLQQGAPENVSIAITIDLASLHVDQDIAVPVAFFITELVELAMARSGNAEIAVVLTPPADDRLAQLSVHAEALRTSDELAIYGRYQRVLTGLARQMRTHIERSEDGATFCIEIPVR